MANGTIAFDTLSTSGQITGTAKSVDTDYVVNGSAKVWCSWTGVGAVAYNSLNVTSLTDTSTTENLVTYTNGFNTAGHMAISYASNHNSGGLDNDSSSDLCVFSPNTGSAKFKSISNANAAYQACNINGDLA